MLPRRNHGEKPEKFKASENTPKSDKAPESVSPQRKDPSPPTSKPISGKLARALEKLEGIQVDTSNDYRKLFWYELPGTWAVPIFLPFLSFLFLSFSFHLNVVRGG
jgi:hypothetical protein